MSYNEKKGRKKQGKEEREEGRRRNLEASQPGAPYQNTPVTEITFLLSKDQISGGSVVMHSQSVV